MRKLVCERFCSFYKPGRESMECGAFLFLRNNLTPGELELVAGGAKDSSDLSEDGRIKSLICEGLCEFYATGDCDFRLGLDSPPCGAYKVVEEFLTRTGPLTPLNK